MRGTAARLGRFVGIDIPEDEIHSIRKELYSLLGDDYFQYENNKFMRDGENWHITFAVYSDYRNLSREEKDLLYHEVEYQITGIGTVTESSGEAVWFATVSSPQIDIMLEKAGLPARDLHITMGFTDTDIHSLPKNADTRIIKYVNE